MELKNAIELIWENKKYTPSSEIEALSHLNEETAKSLKAMLDGDTKKAQAELEDALSCLFIALKTLNINLEDAVFRQVNKMKTHSKRIMHIYSDRVEIRVDNEIKAGWAIGSAEELNEAEKMAREFNCEIIKEDQSQQLTLGI